MQNEEYTSSTFNIFPISLLLPVHSHKQDTDNDSHTVDNTSQLLFGGVQIVPFKFVQLYRWVMEMRK